MTPTELKRHVIQTGSYFFTRDTMRFFGDTMENYGCHGEGAYWVLTRKRPVKEGRYSSEYFDKKTFKRRTGNEKNI